MYKAVTLPAGSSLTAMVSYQIELNWDYAYVVVSTDNGLSWDSVETNLSTTTDPNGQNFGFGITGETSKWTELEADLSAYEGDVLVGFRYWTDGALTEPGFMADDVMVTGLATDGAETDTGWAYEGFKRTTGHESGYYTNYYLAENRQYVGYDWTLKVGCYNFGFLKGRYAAANLVERFPYQDGLLVWYCDTSQPDNNTSTHPGSGFALPVDSHPVPLLRPDKKIWRNRVQAYDATFGLGATDAITLHYNSRLSAIPSLPGVATFNDNNSYWSADNPTGSVITPVTGTTIGIVGTSPDGMYVDVRVAPAP